MKRRYELLLTEEQDKILKKKTERMGFNKKSDYIRFILFMELSFGEKIDKIHQIICDNDVR